MILQELKFLNSKEKREIIRSLEEIYGSSEGFEGLMLLSEKEKLYLLTESEFLRSEEDKKLRIDRTGLHVASLTLSGPRLTIEGSQLLGPHATKNIYELDDEQLELYVKGNELDVDASLNGLYLVKYKEDFLGSTHAKGGKMLNSLPKIRRLKNLNR